MRISVMSYVVYTFTPTVVALHKRNANISLGKIISIYFIYVYLYLYIYEFDILTGDNYAVSYYDLSLFLFFG